MPARDARRLGAILSLGFLSILLLACGISYGEDESGTELFKRLTIEGERRPFANLTLVLEYEQPYPTLIDVQCDLLEVESEATPRPSVTPTATLPEGVTPTPPPIPKPRPTPRHRLATLVGEGLPENPEGGPVDEATPISGSIRKEFRSPEFAGRYSVWCYTPADENNGIVRQFTISRANS